VTLGVSVHGGAADLFTAIGLTGADGSLDGSWFEDPTKKARRVVADPVQRAALMRLLESLLPGDDAKPGWHPLLDYDFGNIYITVDGDVIGVAAELHHDFPGAATVRANVQLPLVDVSGDMRAISGSPEGPV